MCTYMCDFRVPCLTPTGNPAYGSTNGGGGGGGANGDGGGGGGDGENGDGRE